MSIHINLLYLAQLLCAGWVAQSIFLNGLAFYYGDHREINKVMIGLDAFVLLCLIYLLT